VGLAGFEEPRASLGRVARVLAQKTCVIGGDRTKKETKILSSHELHRRQEGGGEQKKEERRKKKEERRRRRFETKKKESTNERMKAPTFDPLGHVIPHATIKSC